MPVKNAPTTTWYRVPPCHSPAAPRFSHPSKVASPTHSRHTPSLPSHPTKHGPSQHTPGASSYPLRRASHSLPNVPASPTPTLPPSPGPSSKHLTSTSSSASSSPRRTVPHSSKIVSPTRLRNTDRLPPISKGTTASVVESGDFSTFKKLPPGLRTRLRDAKVTKKKTSDNRNTESGADVSTRKEQRESVKKGRPVGERHKEHEEKNKKTNETKMESKAIPKRKKSERSNSDMEIKPKRMVIKEHPNNPFRVEEPQEWTSATRVPKGRLQDKESKPTKDLRRPTTLKLSNTRPLKDTVKSVEKQFKDLNLKEETADTGTEAVDYGDYIRGHDCVLDARDARRGVHSIIYMDINNSADNEEIKEFEDIEEGERKNAKVVSEVTTRGEESEGEVEDLCQKQSSASAALTNVQECTQDDEMKGNNMPVTDTKVNDLPNLAEVAAGGGEEDHPVDCVHLNEGMDESIVMEDGSVMSDSRVNNGSVINDIPVIKAGFVVDDHVTNDGSTMDSSHVMKDSSVDNMQLICTVDDGYVMEDGFTMDDSHVMKDVSAMDDSHVMKDESGIDGIHIMKDGLALDDSQSSKGDSTLHDINDEDGITEDLPADTRGSVPGATNNQVIMSEGVAPLAIVVAQENTERTETYFFEKILIKDDLVGKQKLEVLRDIPGDNGGTREQGKTNQVVKGRDDKRKTKKREEEVGKVKERRSKRKMDTERTRGGTKKSARVFIDTDVDKLATTPSRPVSPCPSDVSSSDQSHASNLSRVSSRLPIRALHVSGPAHSGSITSLCSTASGGGGSRASRDSRVHGPARNNTVPGEKKRPEPSIGIRRPRLDNIKSTIPKPGRLPPRKLTDPVKAARPGGPTSGPRGPLVGHNGPGQQHPVPHADQLRRLEAEVAARAAEVKAARAERDQAGRGLEALTVLMHHLTNTYDPFATPRLKAEVVRLNSLLTETRLSLDESSAAVRRLQEAEVKSVEQHTQKVQLLEHQHHQSLDHLAKQHQHEIYLALEKHRKELSQFTEDQQNQREALSRAHSAEVEQLEGEWRNKLDLQHEKHLCAVQELNTQHTHKLRELETSRRARERELEEANFRLIQDKEALKIESKKLEETLLNDTDHRLQAVRNMCSSLKSEVDSLKTVVEMKNAEIHELRGQVIEMDRLASDLEVARDRARALQAKTEDLQAQMEKKALQERQLVNEHRLLVETYQRESNANKRLSLENEELAWKLRQREEIMSTSMPSSTLDLVSRSSVTPRRQEGAPSPQAAPRSPRVGVWSPSGKVSPSKCDINKRRSRLGLTPVDGIDGDDKMQEVFESPPPSPCVKAVVEKSNSVSFILDLNDSQSDDSFLDLPPSPRPRPQRTASLSAVDRPRTPTHIRRVIHNNRANTMNKNGLHINEKPKDVNGKPKEINRKTRESNEKPKVVNGKSLDINGHGSRPGSRRTTSESSEGGSEMERISPTGLAWTVPVHTPKSPSKINATRQNGSPVRGRIEHHLLEDPDEDEYEETPSGTHQFIEVVELSGVGLTSSSEAASDSELSQCDIIKGGSSTDSDSDSSDGERHSKQGSSNHQPLGRKNGPWCPKEGAGEAMITDELLKQYNGDPLTIEPLPSRGKRPSRRRLPSAPSSDSDDNNVNPHNDGNNMDVSWSEDVDITSSSEMHEL